MELGKLSEKYEVGKRGTATVGWDSRGLASYGRYQIATGTGTMKTFLSWCRIYYPTISDALDPHRSDMTQKRGQFAKAWLALAAGNPVLAQAEHEFIAEKFYLESLSMIGAAPAAAVNQHPALQQVLWSTAVQHGPWGAANIFNRGWSKGFEIEDQTNMAAYISVIYLRRSQRLSKLTERERKAVLNRYRAEERDAHGLVARDNLQPAGLDG